MAELFLELLSEEIPARMQAKAGEDLARLLTEKLTAAGLTVEGAQIHTGPRRLAVVIPDLAARTADVKEERKGPRVGAPDKAIAGFLRGAGVERIEDCETRSDAKGEFYVAVIEKPGRDTRELLGEAIPAVCEAMPWPKSMRWGERTERWVRPLRRIVCLFGGAVAPVEWAGIAAGDQTQGHRVHGPGPFTVTDFASYRKILESEGHVRIDRAARRALIAEQARAICKEAGLELVEDSALLDEVAGLAEWPIPLLGQFDPEFLELPPEAIRLTMAKNQKYFAVREPGKDGLAPRFVAVADLAPSDGGEASTKGYARVLSARLEDARFFWTEDLARPLAERVEDLAGVVFHRKLGSVKDKAERISALARELAPACGADPDKAARAGLLAKADLTTQMVQEFTDLQGVMGAYYAKADKDPAVADAAVAAAIRDHYKPMGPTDAVPHDPVSITVALADKLDTLVGFWAIDEKPTGSKDPYALRRAALGVIRIVLSNNVRLRLIETAQDHEQAVTETRKALSAPAGLSIQVNAIHGKSHPGYSGHVNANATDLLAFFADRLKVALREDGVRHDLIDAVFALGEDDLVAIAKRVDALQHFIETPEGEDLVAGAKRAMNILEAESKKPNFPADENAFDPGILKDRGAEEEKALAAALDKAQEHAETALANEDYEAAMAAIAPLRPAIDAFFDNVTVNVEGDEALRRNRLLLLRRIRDALGKVADFSRISGG